MEFLILFSVILLNGLFAMSEIALVTARRIRLVRAVDNRTPGAAAALALHDEPTRFLSTVQIGITSIGILSGIYGENALAQPLAEWHQSTGVERELADGMATVIVVAVVTYVAIVFGELVPKRIGQFHPEGIAVAVARPMQGLAQLSRPFVRLLSLSTDGLLKLIGAREPANAPVTEEDIQALLTEGSEAGVIEQHEQQMLRNVFGLDERRAGSLMVPRFDTVFLDVNLPMEDNLKWIADSEHSRFPVCRGGAARRWIMAARRADPHTRTEGQAEPEGRTGRAQGSLPHAERDADVDAGKDSPVRRCSGVGALAPRGGRHGWQANRQGAGHTDRITGRRHGGDGYRKLTRARKASSSTTASDSVLPPGSPPAITPQPATGARLSTLKRGMSAP